MGNQTDRPAEQKILQAALEVFAEKGFVATTMDEVAKRAGVNKAMLYYYVGDKQTLLAQALLMVLVPLRQSVKQLPGLPLSVPQRLAKLQATFAETFAQKPHLPRLMLRLLVTELEHVPREVLAVMADVFAVTRALVTEGVRGGVFRNTNPALVHLLLVGSLGLAAAAPPLLARLAEVGLPPEAAALPDPEQLPQALTVLLFQGLLQTKE